MSQPNLFNSKVNKYELLAQLKLSSNLATFEKNLKQLLVHPITEKIIDATAIAKEYTNLRQSKPTPYTENIEGEIAWFLHAIKKHKDLIQAFITERLAFEKNLLLEDYELSENYLNKIDSISKSLWGINARFLLKEIKGGVEENWSFLSLISKTLKDPYVLFLSEHYSKRAEKKISYFRFRTLIENQLSDISPVIKEYIFFHLDYPSYTSYNAFNFFLHIESNCSIIDRYELLVQIINELVAEELKSSKYDFLPTLIGNLRGLVPNDIRLTQLSNILNPDSLEVLNDSFSLLNLFDHYSNGNFSICIEEVPAIIKTYPSSIELYEMYTKSLIELGLPFKPTNASNLIDQVLLNLYNIYSRNELNSESTEELFKISLSYYFSNWGKQLCSVIGHQSNLVSTYDSHSLLFLVNSSFNNPRILNILKSDSIRFKTTFEKFSAVFKSKTTDILYWINSLEMERLKLEPDIFPLKKSSYIGRLLMKSGDFKRVISHYEQIAKSGGHSIVLHEETIVSLFQSYLNVGDIREAIQLYVRSYLENRHLVLKLKKDQLLEAVLRAGYDDLKDLIDLPIFFQLAKTDTYQLYVTYDVFMGEHSINSPKDITLLDGIEKSKLIFFLRDVCKTDVLNYSIYFDSAEEVEKERIELLKYLMNFDKSNESAYINELTELTQSIAIRNVIREVNKGRITINVQGLKKAEAANIKEGFVRYQEIELYSKDKDWVSLDLTSKSLNASLASLTDEKIKIVHIGDPAFVTFKLMFVEIRDKYIYSKEYGLDGYLSTRIRHGTLLNQIRSVFESLNLTSQKESGGAYVDNEYWNERIPPSLISKRKELQTAIKSFSKRVDDYTESIIRDLIQVKTEAKAEKQFALFDYSFDQKELAYLFAFIREKVKDYNTFYDFVISELENRTKEILSAVRSYFNSEVKNQYDTIIMDFEREVRTIIEENAFGDLTFSITKCTTNIQNELVGISEWFSLSDVSSNLVLDVETLVHTGVQITNSIYPNKQIHPQIKVNKNYRLRGVIHIYDIIRILLNNIINHSGLNSEELDVQISSDFVADKILRLSFTNNLAEIVNLEELAGKLQKVREKWENQTVALEKINIEGGSGFDKIVKILLFDMAQEKLYFDYKIENKSVTISIGFNIRFENEASTDY